MVRLDQRVKAVDDLASHDPRGADLDDAAGSDLAIGRLEVERDVPWEVVEVVEGMEVLKGLEERESEAVFATVVCPDHNLPNLLNLPPRCEGGGHVTEAGGG